MKDTLKLTGKTPKMVAHRGLSGLERENSCAAFIAAGNRRSYFGIETDVHRTADGHYVVIHDADTGRVSATSLDVEKSDLATVRSVLLTDMDGADDRADLRIPTLAEYVKICKKYGKCGVLELKQDFTPEQLEEIIAIIRQADYLDGIIFISFPRQNMITLRQLLPNQPAQWLTADWKEEYYTFLDTYKLDLDIEYHSLTAEIVARLHASGHEINAWTCDNLSDAEKLIELGPDYITSNICEATDPALL